MLLLMLLLLFLPDEPANVSSLSVVDLLARFFIHFYDMGATPGGA